MIVLCAMILAALTASVAGAAEADLTAGTVLPGTWAYSVDGGKTFSSEVPMILATRVPDGKYSVVARCTFTIEDPANIGLLRILTHGDQGALTLSDVESVDRRNVGTRPNLTRTKLILNGEPTDAGHAPFTLYRWLSIEPQLLKKGRNTLSVSGVFWFQFSKDPLPGSLRLETLPADLAVLDRHPVLGPVGEDYFTLAARSVIPADFTVTAEPLEPKGQATQHVFKRSRLLKAKVPLPAGTRKFRYSVRIQAGSAGKSYGPYEVAMPTFGDGFRFMVAGGTKIYRSHPEALKTFLARLEQEKPQVYVHTGNYQNCPAWDWMWDIDFLEFGRDVLSRYPLLPVCGCTEMLSPVSFSRTFYFPSEDKDCGHWSYTVGRVRFVAIEAFSQSQAKDPAAAAKWLDDILGQAKEDYVIVLNSHVGNCGKPARMFRPGLAHVEKHIDPILIKHKVTVTIGGIHPLYQRVELPAEKGVPTLVVGRSGGLGGPNAALGWARGMAATKAAAIEGHYCIFEVKKDKLVMQAFGLDGNQIDRREYAPRKAP